MSRLQTVRCLWVMLSINASLDAGSLDLDFSALPPASIASFAGSATWRSTGGFENTGYVSLTDALTFQMGSLILSDIDAGAPVRGFTIDAMIRLGGGSEFPADGISFNFVRPNDPLLASGGLDGWATHGAEPNLPEEGATTGLAIGFDEWDSGNGDVIGMSVRVDGQLINQVSIPQFHGAALNTASLQTGPAGLSLTNIDALQWAPLQVSLNDSRLVVSYKNQVFVDQFVDFTTSPGRVVIGGRTGGSTSHHHLDHLRVSTNGPFSLGRIPTANEPVSINTLSSSVNLDTEIALFDASGQLLFTNDNADNSLLSEISASLTPGSYFLAIGPSDTAFDSGFLANAGSSTGGSYNLDVGPTRMSGLLRPNGLDWFSFDVTAFVPPPPAPIEDDIAIPNEFQNELGRRAYVARSVENLADGTIYHLVRGFHRLENLTTTTELGRDGAETVAKILGGHLVNISDRNEDEFLREAFPGDPDTGLDYKYWINLTRAEAEQSRWGDGEALTYTNWFADEPFDVGAYVLNYDAADFQWYTSANVLLGEPGMSAIVEVPRNSRQLIPLDQMVVVDTPSPSRESFAGDDDDVPAHWDGLQLIPHGDEDGQPITAGGKTDFIAKAMLELDLPAALGEEAWARVPSDSMLTLRFKGYYNDHGLSSLDALRAKVSTDEGHSATDQQDLAQLLLTNGCEWDFVLTYPLGEVVDFDDTDSAVVEIELEYFDGDFSNMFFDFSTSTACTTSPPTGMENGGLELNEIFLSTPSSPRGDLNGDLALTAADIDLLTAQIRIGSDDQQFDLDADGLVDVGDLETLVRDLVKTYFGDADLDGRFDTADLVDVLSSGEYEDGIVKNSTWSTGDWNGDGEFSSSDLVVALADGGFEQGPRVASPAVPEPSGALALSLGCLLMHRLRPTCRPSRSHRAVRRRLPR
jgi:hypothetical protein